jgi:homoserine dehydrogenase
LRIALLLAGYGNVARRFVQLLNESKPYLDSVGVTPVVAGIVTRRHGQAFDEKGLPPEILSGAELPRDSGARDTNEFLTTALERLGHDSSTTRVVVETTTLDVQTGEPAISHVRTAFAAGAHVITANKGPVALAYRALAGEARSRGLSFLFEGAVMDGIPIFNLIRETMPAVTIRSFRGVVNTTTNYLLAAMEAGESFGDALARMQADGVAEADPSLDVDGWDAAAKTAALANVWLDADITPQMIAREGISAATGERARAALARGRRLKLVASAQRDADKVSGRVALIELPPDDPLAILEAHGNALEIDSWPLGRVVITQRDGGLEKTAYALLSDLVRLSARQSSEAQSRETQRRPRQ